MRKHTLSVIFALLAPALAWAGSESQAAMPEFAGWRRKPPVRDHHT